MSCHLGVQDETARGGAALASCSSAGEDAGANHQVNVGTFVNQDGVVATQFQQMAAETLLYRQRHLKTLNVPFSTHSLLFPSPPSY